MRICPLILVLMSIPVLVLNVAAQNSVAETTPEVVSDQSEVGQGEDGDAGVSAELVGAAAEDDTPVLTEADTVLVDIRDDGPSPKRLLLLPGTTVVWKNDTKKPIQVHFIGKAISTTCKAPRGFAIGGKGVYNSTPIPSGGVASLCFLEPELYVYEIRSPDAHRNSGESRSVGAIQIVRQ